MQSVSQFTLFSKSFRAISASASTSPPTIAATSLPWTAFSWRDRKYKHKQKKPQMNSLQTRVDVCYIRTSQRQAAYSPEGHKDQQHETSTGQQFQLLQNSQLKQRTALCSGLLCELLSDLTDYYLVW